MKNMAATTTRAIVVPEMMKRFLTNTARRREKPMNKRRKLSRSERIAVFDKTRGHCAYCGCELRFADMQIDHLVSLYNGGTDNMANYLPACRSCNHYKSTLDIEKFRAALERMPDVLRRDNGTYRIAVRFGLVTPTPHSVRFYFEDNPPQKEEETACRM